MFFLCAIFIVGEKEAQANEQIQKIDRVGIPAGD